MGWRARRGRAQRTSEIVAATIVALLAVACGTQAGPPEEGGSETADEELADKILALGYLDHAGRQPGDDRRGVVQLDPERTRPGVTVFGQRTGTPEAYFFDRRGRLLTTLAPKPSRGNSLLWMEPTADGHLIVSGRGYLMKVSWSGRTIWEAPRRSYHHGFALAPDGTVFAMTGRPRSLWVGERKVRIIDNQILELSPEGKVRRTISMLDLLGREILPPRILELLAAGDETIPEAELERDFAVASLSDVFHLNSVAVLRRDIGTARAGDLMLSLRSLDLVLAVDPRPRVPAVRWRWDAGRAVLDRQHAPWPLANGNLLVFDNGWRRGFSRLLEVDPRREEVVWEYGALPRETFYSRLGGMAQPLPDGNILVTVSALGRVFEITRQGDIVWDFWNPHFSKPEGEDELERETIYRAWRWYADDLKGADVPASVRAATLD